MTVDPSVLAGVRLTADLPADLRGRIAGLLAEVHVAGGEWVVRQGEPGDTMYLVRSGRLEVLRTQAGDRRVLGVLQPGDTFGELALVQGGTRVAGVRALRDTELLALHRRDVAPLLADPHFAAALLRLTTAIARAEHAVVDPAARRTVVAVLGRAPTAVTALVDGLADALRTQGVGVAVLRHADVDDALTTDPARVGRVLGRLESDHDVVLVDGGVADPAGPDGTWGEVCARQADRVVVVAAPGEDPPRADADLSGCDLVVAGRGPMGVADLDRWDARLRPRAHHRVRDRNRRSDVARLARRLTGRALGVVLSGGGARGLAHIGVLQALEEAGVTIDRYGGTSMGALVSALAATGRPAAEIRRIAIREMVERRPFRDYTVPRVALIRGVAAEAMLQRVLGDVDVRQLPRSWFAVSAALEDAELVVHRRGPAWEATACSMSLPGLAPPRIHDGRVVVDGGVLDNLPVGIMADDGEGQVVAADVTRQRAFVTDGGPPRIPGIVEVLAATMALSNLQQTEVNRRRSRVVVEPQVSDVGLLDFGQIDAAIAAGHTATRAALEVAGDLLHPAVAV